MPPQSKSPSLYLKVQPQPFFLVRLHPSKGLPPDILDRLAKPIDGSNFLSVTRTTEEVSIISDFRIDGGTDPATEWCCIRVAGPMDLNLTGIMNDLTAPLKTAKVPIFALSTWDTDWLLVPSNKSEEAAQALREDGWTVQG